MNAILEADKPNSNVCILIVSGRPLALQVNVRLSLIWRIKAPLDH